METARGETNGDGDGDRLAETQRLLDEMDRLDLRARLLLAEHRHVVATISDLQQQLEHAVSAVIATRSPENRRP